MIAGTTFFWVRHGPTGVHDRYVGRTDLPAKLPEPSRLGPLWDALTGTEQVIASPAVRTRQTAGALFPGEPMEILPALQEQDFGDWEDRQVADCAMPARLDAAGIAAFRPPGGESFAEVCARTGAAIAGIASAYPGATLAVIAHAGVIRAALVHALAAEPATGIAFDIAPLSLTRITLFGGEGSRVDYVNRPVIDLPA